MSLSARKRDSTPSARKSGLSARRAHDDWDKASFKAFWRKLSSWILGEQNDLLPFEEVRSRLELRGQHYRGLEQVPIDQIVGSVGRYRDFDRAFFPTRSSTRDRWIAISRARYEDVDLPPVDLYKIGDIYFVKDGNHRISVARERGQEFVDANVTEVPVPVPVTPDSDLDKVVLENKRRQFLEASELWGKPLEARFEASVAEHYEKLLEHVSAHRWYMGQKRGAGVSREEASADWYERIYWPLLEILREHGIFESVSPCDVDLYLWIVRYQEYLRQAPLDDEKAPREAREMLVQEHPDAPAVRKLARVLGKGRGFLEHVLEEEYARFLERTGLHRERPDADLHVTLPQGYPRLTEHISTHRWYLGEAQGREIAFDEAARSWHDGVYLPLIEIVRGQDVLRLFPGRTEADLYLWIIERRAYLREHDGFELSLEEAVGRVARERGGRSQPK